MSRACLALIASALAVQPLAAQRPTAPPGIRRGADVRVYARDSLVQGRLVGLTPAGLVVAEDGRAVTLARSDIVEWQVRRNGRWTPVPPDQLAATWDSLPGVAMRVRVTHRGRQTTGTLVEWREDTLLLADSRGRARAVPVKPGARVEVSGGRGNAVVGGLVTGLVLGAAGGAGAANGLCSSLSWGGNYDCGGAAAGGAAMGGLVLGLVGAGVGAAIKTEKWIEVPADSVRAFLHPSR